MSTHGPPEKQGLYDPQFEHDACGVGFVCQMKGKRSHDIVEQALTILVNLDHRGAVRLRDEHRRRRGHPAAGAAQFLKKVAAAQGSTLPEPGQYRRRHGFHVAGSDGARAESARDVRADRRRGRPAGPRLARHPDGQLDRSARRRRRASRSCGRSSSSAARTARTTRPSSASSTSSASARTTEIRARGSGRLLVLPEPLVPDHDLQGHAHAGAGRSSISPTCSDPDMDTALALVHSRFSTNTFPSWERSHPYRYIAHNGEINTLRGNINWMHARAGAARERTLRRRHQEDPADRQHERLGLGDVRQRASNCSSWAGRSLPHAMMMMIPEPWSGHESMSDEKKAFYEYHSCLMEPWDGPASVAFTDGTMIGATLDRNGLRPSRYYVTKDDLVIMASEAGVLPVAPERVAIKGRLQPGRMFLVDMEEGRIVADEEIKDKIAAREALPPVARRAHGRAGEGQGRAGNARAGSRDRAPAPAGVWLHVRRSAHAHAADGAATASKPSARWAPIRRSRCSRTSRSCSTITSSSSSRRSPIRRSTASARRSSPRPRRRSAPSATCSSRAGELPPDRAEVADPHQRGTREAQARRARASSSRSRSRSSSSRRKAPQGLEKAMDEICAQADRSIAAGMNIIILSDRGVNKDNAADPRAARRRRAAPSSDPRRHAHARRPRARIRRTARSASLLDAHRLRLRRDQSVSRLRDARRHDPPGPARGRRSQDRVQELRQGRDQGRRQGRVEDRHLDDPELSRRADLRSVGLNQAVVDKYFTWTATRIEGADIDVHREGSADAASATPSPTARSTATRSMSAANTNGARKARRTSSTRRSIHTLQKAVRTGNYEIFKEYSALVNEQSKKHLHAARPARFQEARRRCRSRKSSRSRRSSSASRPAR